MSVLLRAARYGGQPSRVACLTRPANRSRERSERLAKVGGPDFHQLEPIDELDAQNRGLQIGRMSKVC